MTELKIKEPIYCPKCLVRLLLAAYTQAGTVEETKSLYGCKNKCFEALWDEYGDPIDRAPRWWQQLMIWFGMRRWSGWTPAPRAKKAFDDMDR